MGSEMCIRDSLNIVCQGTDFQMVVFLKKGHGTPSSKLCAEKFMTHWVSWAGWPTEVKVDRGLHNRGYFARMLGAHGICPRHAALESPEQIGKTERAGDIWKMNAKRVINDRQIKTEKDMELLAAEMNSVINDGTRKGGYSCSQWVLGKFPRRCHDLISGENSISQVSEKLNLDSEF